MRLQELHSGLEVLESSGRPCLSFPIKGVDERETKGESFTRDIHRDGEVLQVRVLLLKVASVMIADMIDGVGVGVLVEPPEARTSGRRAAAFSYVTEMEFLKLLR